MTDEWLFSALTTPAGQAPGGFAVIARSQGFRDCTKLREVRRFVGSMGWKSGAFIFEQDGRVYFGLSGEAPDFLGESHQYAYEHGSGASGSRRGRPIPFLYFFSSGGAVPGLTQLRETVSTRLAEVLYQAHSAHSVPIAPAGGVVFTSAPSDTWKEAIESVGKRPRRTQFAYLSGANRIEWIDVLAASASTDSAFENAEPSDERGSSFVRLALAVAAAIAALAALMTIRPK